MISKQDKDHTQFGNYQPIALLNADLKLFLKILANRFLPYLPQLVHADQAGFIPQREARDNTTRAIELIHIAHSESQPFLLFQQTQKRLLTSWIGNFYNPPFNILAWWNECNLGFRHCTLAQQLPCWLTGFDQSTSLCLLGRDRAAPSLH